MADGYALTGRNIVYDTHVHVRWHSSAEDWNAHFGRLAARVPLIATEFGSLDCTQSRTGELLDYFLAHRMSWTVWSWNSPGQCSQPSALADWSGTPLQGQGQLVFDWMRHFVAPRVFGL